MYAIRSYYDINRKINGGWIPPTREIFPFVIGSMSFGALSPNMWLGLLQGVAYCNEVLGIPVRNNFV